MPTRPLGSTGLQVSPVGLGLAALGRPAYIDLGRDADLGDDRGVEALERRCHQVLDAAFAAGVRYLDAARSYGRAEAFLASWLRAREVDPAEVTVGSKWGYTYVGDWRMDAEVHEVKDHSLAALTRQARESRDLLGRHLDLYQVHSATLDSGVLADRAVLDELARLRDHGVVIGLSSSGPGQAATIRRALEVGRRRRGPVRLRAGDLEPAGAVGRPRPGRGERGRLGRDRQGGGRQRPAHPARCTARPLPSSTGSRPATRSGWTRSPSPPCWPTPGPTSSCPGRSPPPSSRPTWPPSGSS